MCTILEFFAVTLSINDRLGELQCNCQHTSLSELPVDGLVSVIVIAVPIDPYEAWLCAGLNMIV